MIITIHGTTHECGDCGDTKVAMVEEASEAVEARGGQVAKDGRAAEERRLVAVEYLEEQRHRLARPLTP